MKRHSIVALHSVESDQGTYAAGIQSHAVDCQFTVFSHVIGCSKALTRPCTSDQVLVCQQNCSFHAVELTRKTVSDEQYLTTGSRNAKGSSRTPSKDSAVTQASVRRQVAKRQRTVQGLLDHRYATCTLAGMEVYLSLRVCKTGSCFFYQLF